MSHISSMCNRQYLPRARSCVGIKHSTDEGESHSNRKPGQWEPWAVSLKAAQSPEQALLCSQQGWEGRSGPKWSCLGLALALLLTCREVFHLEEWQR